MTEFKVQEERANLLAEEIANDLATQWLEHIATVEEVTPESRLYYWRVFNSIPETDIFSELKSRILTLVVLVLQDCSKIEKINLQSIQKIFSIRSSQIIKDNYLPEEFGKEIYLAILNRLFPEGL